MVQADLRLEEHHEYLAVAGIYPRDGTRDDVEAVEPLINNDFSPPIAQLAAAVVKDLKARPPAKPAAAPGQEKK